MKKNKYENNYSVDLTSYQNCLSINYSEFWYSYIKVVRPLWQQLQLLILLHNIPLLNEQANRDHMTYDLKSVSTFSVIDVKQIFNDALFFLFLQQGYIVFLYCFWLFTGYWCNKSFHKLLGEKQPLNGTLGFFFCLQLLALQWCSLCLPVRMSATSSLQTFALSSASSSSWRESRSRGRTSRRERSCWKPLK